MSANTFLEPVHRALSGRLRFKVNGLYCSELMKQFIEAKLAGKKGIYRVSINVFTSRVLVYYNSDTTPSAVEHLLEEIVLEYEKQNVGSNDDDFLVLPSRREKTIAGSKPTPAKQTERKPYENEEEESLHADLIRRLSVQYGVEDKTVKEMYEGTLLELKREARIKDFISMLVERRVKETLSAGQARTS